MKRAILTPVTPPPQALAELKDWLAISTTADDAALTVLLRTGLDMCEAFIGALPVQARCEEQLPAIHGWQTLSTRPVQAITRVEGLALDGSRTALTSGTVTFDLDADGGGRVRVMPQPGMDRVIVTLTAGVAPDWASLPDNLRHGIMRLAAHQYRQRESDGAAPLPPASVAALWRPWRRLRLA